MLSWKQWEIVVCQRLQLEPARTKPGESGPDCKCNGEVGGLIVDAKRWSKFPRWIKRVHARTRSYAKSDQFPVTVFRDIQDGDDLVLVSLRDFERFVLPALQERRRRGWW